MDVQLFFELGHTSKFREIDEYDIFTHDWNAYIRGIDDAPIHVYIEKVIFNIYSGTNFTKKVLKNPPYRVEASAYESVRLHVDLFFRNTDGAKCAKFDYNVNLKTNIPVFRDHVIKTFLFEDPSFQFRRKLIDNSGVSVAQMNQIRIQTSLSQHNLLNNKKRNSVSQMSSKSKGNYAHLSNNNIEKQKVRNPLFAIGRSPIKMRQDLNGITTLKTLQNIRSMSVSQTKIKQPMNVLFAEENDNRNIINGPSFKQLKNVPVVEDFNSTKTTWDTHDKENKNIKIRSRTMSDCRMHEHGGLYPKKFHPITPISDALIEDILNFVHPSVVSHIRTKKHLSANKPISAAVTNDNLNFVRSSVKNPSQTLSMEYNDNDGVYSKKIFSKNEISDTVIFDNLNFSRPSVVNNIQTLPIKNSDNDDVHFKKSCSKKKIHVSKYLDISSKQFRANKPISDALTNDNLNFVHHSSVNNIQTFPIKNQYNDGHHSKKQRIEVGKNLDISPTTMTPTISFNSKKQMSAPKHTKRIKTIDKLYSQESRADTSAEKNTKRLSSNNKCNK